MEFREYHLTKILEGFQASMPLDVFLSRYFRAHRAIGSKDRRYLSETIYERFRRGFPENLSTLLREAYGEEKAQTIQNVSNRRAPLVVRSNPLKITRDALLSRWKELPVQPAPLSPHGIVFKEKINFHTLPEFKEGLFEIQDEGSQLIALLIEAKPSDHVLDFCAGSGGKTLAFAHLLENRGQIYLHDIRPKALREAKKRLRRAGVQNIQFRLPRQTVDWILVDAPCTGTGTLRRNPDIKSKFSHELLERMIQEQRSIFAEALAYLKPNGKIVYATCSILPQENEHQAAYFEKKYGLHIVKTMQTFPCDNGPDGFFGIVMEKKPLNG